MSYFDEDNDLTIKVVIVGNGAVGKSSLIQRYCRGIFTNQYKKTIGVDFLEKTIDINTQKIRLMCWDTAGQEEFDALTNAYYRGAHACVIAFSTTDRESFNSVSSWHKKIEYNCGIIPTILVQNKIDLHQNTAVSRDEVNELSAKNKLPLFLTSSKENINIENAFYFLAKSYCDSLNAVESPVLKNKVNYFLSNKINKNQPQIRIPYRPINDENKYKNNEIIFKPIYKNCWPSNPMIINNNKNFFNDPNQPKIVIGRQNQLNVSTEPKLIKNYLPVTIPAKLNPNQKLYNCNLIKQPARNQTNKKFQIQPSIHYLKNSNQSQCIDTYFLIRNQDQIKLHDDLFNKYYPNNDKTKQVNDKKKTFFKNNIFPSCKII